MQKLNGLRCIGAISAGIMGKSSTGDVVEAKSVPDDNIFIDDEIRLVNPALDSSSAEGLVGIVSSREQLAVLVLGDPKGLLSKLRTAPMPGARVSE